MKNIAVVGCGYWGAKHARVLSELDNVRLHSVVDMDVAKVESITSKYPGVRGLNNLLTVLQDPEIDGLTIATPASTHFALALKALEFGKSVMVEKPLTLGSEEARTLIALAKRQGLTLMVGHTFEYHPAVEVLRQVVQSGDLGELYYLDAARLNLGLYQRDVNVIHDLCPHDVSTMIYVLGEQPVEVAAKGYSLVHESVIDMANIEYRFASGLIANSRVSWLSPKKTRELTVVGSRKMVVYNDIAEHNKIEIFDRGIMPPNETEKFSEWQFAYQYGDTNVVPVPAGEPLKLEFHHFAECIETGKTPQTDGTNGLRVVSVLEAIQESCQNGGRPQPVHYGEEALPENLDSDAYQIQWEVGAKGRKYAMRQAMR